MGASVLSIARARPAKVVGYVSEGRKAKLVALRESESARVGRPVSESELVDQLLGIALDSISVDGAGAAPVPRPE